LKYRTKYLLILDLLGANGALVLAYMISMDEPLRYFNPTAAGVVRGVVIMVSVLFASYFMELYSRDTWYDLAGLAARIAIALNLSFLGLLFFVFLIPTLTVGQKVLTCYLLGFGVIQFLFHAGFRYVERKLELLPRVLILGVGPLAAKMGDILTGLDHSFVLTGFMQAGSEQIAVPRDKILGEGVNLIETALKRRVDKIVVAVNDRFNEYPLQEILSCKLRGIAVLDAPTFYERVMGKMLIEQITPEWFIFSQGFQISALKRAIKRSVDVLISLLVLPVLVIFFPLIALIIKLDSKGPVFFGQTRVGENEKTFTLYKLRSMDNNAEVETGAVWAQDNDPRITRIGNFLRKCRLDEFPQLYNVLRGDMSIVGPRPERPEFIEQLKEIIPYYSERHLIKPGVTGWAQVNYPYGASVEDAVEKLRYDLYYLKNFSTGLDIMIILETIKVIFNQRGGR
jgi:sugar transferase (PEP-CTERM system associated)